MEKRQLNLNAPLLSTRRFSSPVEVIEKYIQRPPKPGNASKWESDFLLKKPAAAGGIPFHWEQSPGRPKDGIGTPAGNSKLDAFRPYHSGELPRIPTSGEILRIPPARASYHSGEASRMVPPGRFSYLYHSGEAPRIPRGRVLPYQWQSGEVPRIPPGRGSYLYHSGEAPRVPLGRASYHSCEVSRIIPPGRTSYHSAEVVPRLLPGRFSSDERIQSSCKPQVESLSFSEHANLVQKLNESLNCDEETGSESEHDTYSDALDMLSPRESGGSHSSPVVKPNKPCLDTQARDLMMNRFLRAAKAAVVETPGYAVKKCACVNNKLPKPVEKAVVYRETTPIPNVSYGYHHHTNEAESENDQDCKSTVKKSRKAWSILPRLCVKNALRLLNPLSGIKSRIWAASTPTPSRITGYARSGPLDKRVCPVPVAETVKKKFYSGLLSRDVLTNEKEKLTTEFGLSPLRRYRNGNSSPFRRFSGPIENSNANQIASSRKLFNALNNVSRNYGSVEAVEKTVYIDKSSYRKNEFAAVQWEDIPDPYLRPTAKVEDFAVRVDAKQDQSCAADRTPSHKSGSESKSQDSAANRPDTKKRDNQNLKSHSRKQVESTTPLALAPPLPDSPSESWLWKTLPSIPQSKAQQLQKARSLDAKRETAVKASTNRGQLRPYSQELVPRSIHRHGKS